SDPLSLPLSSSPPPSLSPSPPPPQLSTLSLHDALPICGEGVPFPDPPELSAGGRGCLPHRDRRARGRHHQGRGQRSRFSGRSHRSEEHTSELQSLTNLVCRLLLEKKKKKHCPRTSTLTN